MPASGAAISTSGSTEAASIEAGEPTLPSCAGGVPVGHTVWYRVVPEASGVVTASTAGSTFDTVLAIYTGSSLTSLHEVGCNDDVSADDTTSEALFGAVAGQTYFLQLSGFDAAAGKFQLQVSLDTSRTAPPPTVTWTPIPTSTIPPTATLTPTPPAAPAAPGALGAAGTLAPVAGTMSPPGPAGGPSALARPATVAVSALAPSITRFVLPAGDELAISLDPTAIAALQVALPSVTQLWITFDPQPVLLDERQRGSLGGGNVMPVGPPFYLAVVPKDSTGMTVVPPMPAGTGTSEGGLPSDVLARALESVQVQLLLPVVSYPSQPGGVFAWLYSVSELGEFQGYARPAAAYVPPWVLLTAATFGSSPAVGLPSSAAGAAAGTGPPGPPARTIPPMPPGQASSAPLQPALPSLPPGQTGPLAPAGPLTGASLSPLGALSLRLSAGMLQGTLFLPAVLLPAYVQNFDPEVHIYSGPGRDAVDYGIAAPQFTTFTVVGPQVGWRIFVFNPVTQNYGWIDASGVGPVPGPPP